MKNSILLGLLALSTTMFAHVNARVDVSANLIKAVEITSQTSVTQSMITNIKTGAFSLPDVALNITGTSGKSIELTAPQSLVLKKDGTDATKVANLNITFGGTGSITTDGTNAKAVHILPASGSVSDSLKLSGNLPAALEAGSYRGTIEISALYN